MLEYLFYKYLNSIYHQLRSFKGNMEGVGGEDWELGMVGVDESVEISSPSPTAPSSSIST